MKFSAKKNGFVMLGLASICCLGALWTAYRYQGIHGQLKEQTLARVRIEFEQVVKNLAFDSSKKEYDIQKIIARMPSLGKNGYVVIMAPDGTVLAHPNRMYLTKNVIDIATQEHNNALNANMSAFLNARSEGGYFEYNDLNMHKGMFYRRVPGTGLVSAAIVSFDDIWMPMLELLRKMFIVLVSMIVFATLFLCCAYFLLRGAHKRKIYIVLTIVFLVLIGGMWLLWYNEQRCIAVIDKSFETVTGEKQVNSFTSNAVKNRAEIFVRTGIFIESCQYLPPDQIRVAAYLWQRYPTGVPETVARDFLLPDCNEYKVREKIIHEKGPDGELIVWFVTGTFNQEHFSAINFPFDDQDIHLQIRHPSLGSTVYLVPDFATYKTFVPRYLPGVSPLIDQSDRFFVESFFAYRTHYGRVTDQLFSRQDKKPELYFVVVAGRGLVGIIINYLLPIFLALLTLYACLVLVCRGADRIQTASLVAAVFLAITLLHSSMRAAVGVPGVISYLEYYYLVLYIVCCIVLAYVLSYGNYGEPKIFEKTDTVMVRDLFFPIYLFVMFVITVLIFY